MSDPTAKNFFESVRAKIPVWMTRIWGFRFIVNFMLIIDIAVEALLEGFYAGLPGVGTPTALPFIGRSRGMVRGIGETDESFAARLIQWLDRWRTAGTALAVAREIQGYVGTTSKVKVVNRNGVMVVLNAGGSVHSIQQITWDWDSLSHPFRAGYWSELWVIVYDPPWAISDAIDTSDPATLGLGLGTKSPRVDVDAIKNLLFDWTSGHSYVRAILWAYDSTLFNPASPSTMPDGTWGSWGYTTGNHCQLSGRGVMEQANRLRTWEPQREPAENLRRAI